MKRLKCGEGNVSAHLGGEVQLFFDAACIQSTSWCTGGTAASRTEALEKHPGKRLHTWLYNAKAINLKQQLCNTPLATHLSPGVHTQQWKVKPASPQGLLPTCNPVYPCQHSTGTSSISLSLLGCTNVCTVWEEMIDATVKALPSSHSPSEFSFQSTAFLRHIS